MRHKYISNGSSVTNSQPVRWSVLVLQGNDSRSANVDLPLSWTHTDRKSDREVERSVLNCQC